MHLLAAWAERRRLSPPTVLTVDHDLRPGSDRDAVKVKRWAKSLGLDAHILRWVGQKPKSDIEAEARQARYRLMGQWLRRGGFEAVCIAHTQDDQAETFLLRLARGSGLDGLAAMGSLAPFPVHEFRDLAVVRPLLSLGRDVVRAHLSIVEQTHLEDPMNSDERFARVHLRRHRATLDTLGLTASRVADAALHLHRARAALDEVTIAVLARSCRIDGESALIDRSALAAAPREIGLRALARLLMTISGHTYRPRFDRLERVFNWLEKGNIGKSCTLHGCHIGRAPKARAAFGTETLLIAPEPGRRTRKDRKSEQRPRNRHTDALS
jgi:tRNA(Ile)-lysidine synthase